MRLWLIFFGLVLSVFQDGHCASVKEKVLICGVCKDIEKAVPNTIQSINELGAQFLDYRVVIYENNSKDHTKKLFSDWAKKDKRVIFMSEHVKKRELASQLKMKKKNRTEMIARARNKVLDVIMQDQYDDYKYVIWADLDFTAPWDIANILDTILHPEQEWDAVLANGSYDLFAFRDPQFPIGYELLGSIYWQRLNDIYSKLILDKNGPWRKVYSAFGGLGIYKREAIKGCRYAGVVTKDLEKTTLTWLKAAEAKKDICFLKEYEAKLQRAQVIDLTKSRLSNRNAFPDEIGIRLKNEFGLGKLVWFSCTRKDTLPSTCEHVPFHASMAVRGYDRIFINPRLISNHP